MMMSQSFQKSLRFFSFGLLVFMIFLLPSNQNFSSVRGQELSNPSDYFSETNTFSPQISLIREELLKDTLSPQMRTSLTEKLSLLEKYAEIFKQGERISASKDDHLINLSPEVIDPQFQQGIFPGGDHLLREQTFSANNYFQTEYNGNYIQVVAGKNLSTQTGTLYLIITSENKTNSKIINVRLLGSIDDLTIVSYEDDTITLVDRVNQVYRFDLESKIFYPGY
jgi:hypothetical protein